MKTVPINLAQARSGYGTIVGVPIPPNSRGIFEYRVFGLEGGGDLFVSGWVRVTRGATGIATVYQLAGPDTVGNGPNLEVIISEPTESFNVDAGSDGEWFATVAGLLQVG